MLPLFLPLCGSFGPGDSPSPARRRSPAAVMATGTPDSQARFGQSVKGLLTEKVNTCGTDVIALTKQVLKGSRSSEVSGGEAPGRRASKAVGRGARCILGVVGCGPWRRVRARPRRASVAFWDM